MPGLVGYFGNPPPAGMRAHLEQMMTALEPDTIYQRQLYVEPEVGLGRVTLGILNPQTQPVWNPEKTRCIFLEGEFYDQEALIKCLDERRRAGYPEGDAGLLLNLYDETGLDCVRQLNGSFIAAIWEPGVHKLVLMNDRLGTYPLYYASYNGRFAFASGVRALMADPGLSRKIDQVGIAEFLTFDHLLHDHTLLEAVKLMRQASILIITPQGVETHSYFDFKFPNTYPQRSEEDYIHEYVALLDKAVARQSKHTSSLGILLSGGMDSRFILPYLHQHANQFPVKAFTWGDPACDDVIFARQAARTVGVEHHVFGLSPDWLLHKAVDAVRLTDGMGNLVNLHAIATLDREVQQANVIMKGFLGDAMFGFAVRPVFWATYLPEDEPLVHFQLHQDQGVISFTPEEQKRFFTDEFQGSVGNAVMDEYIAGMRAADAESLADQRIYFDFRQRVPRMTIKGVEVVRSLAMARLPFADNDLVDFSLRLPPGIRLERNMVRHAFIQTFPKLAQIPITPSGLPLMSCARDVRIRFERLARWHLIQRGVLKGPYAERKPYAHYAEWFRTNLRPWVENTLLNERSFSRGYYRPEALQQLVREHIEGKDHAVRLGALMSIELWHQLYLD